MPARFRPFLGAAVAAALIVVPAASAGPDRGTSPLRGESSVTDAVRRPSAPGAAPPSGVAALDLSRLAPLAVGEHTLVTDLVLEANIRVTLDLERFEILAPGASVVVGTAGGDRAMAPSGLVLLRGTIVGEDDTSTAFVGLGACGVNGFVSRDGFLYSISGGPYTGVLGPGGPVLVTPASALPVGPGMGCGYSPRDPRYNPPYGGGGGAGPFAAAPAPATHAAPRGAPCGLATIAVDTDWEFTGNLFGGDTAAAADYAMTLFGAVATVYRRDVGVTQLISYLRVWAGDVDPYGGEPDMGPFLDHFRNHWNANMTGVPRTIAHALSGRGLGGGVAYVGVLCNGQWGYGVSTSLGGSFPVPLADHQGGNWDPFVVAHETGHNFGTGHTHDSYDPVIDGCGNGDCSAAWGGTIMSYCHGCPGGMANIVMAFHPRVQEVIEAAVAAAGCITDVPGATTAADDRADTLMDAAVSIDALANDIERSCATPSIAAFDATSAGGGAVAVVPGDGHDRFRYTPAAGFTGDDTFTYAHANGNTATVTVGVHAMMPADHPADPQPGVHVEYYLLSDPSSLPDFAALTPLYGAVVPNIDFPETDGIFATGPFANTGGAVFEGFVDIPFPGLFTFEVESDDGSRVSIGDELVIEHDGLHGMEAKRGVAALLPGLHRVRVEYFEAYGGAGLILRSGYYGSVPAVVPAADWFHADTPPCPPDRNGDGTLDFFDVQAFLNVYAAADAGADFNADGAIDFFDLAAFLNAYAAGCP